MSIEAAVKKALKDATREPGFSEQLKRNQNFSERMERAGVVTRKQQFSIPLMERIARSG
jgi:hypothetical protein